MRVEGDEKEKRDSQGRTGWRSSSSVLFPSPSSSSEYSGLRREGPSGQAGDYSNRTPGTRLPIGHTTPPPPWCTCEYKYPTTKFQNHQVPSIYQHTPHMAQKISLFDSFPAPPHKVSKSLVNCSPIFLITVPIAYPCLCPSPPTPLTQPIIGEPPVQLLLYAHFHLLLLLLLLFLHLQPRVVVPRFFCSCRCRNFLTGDRQSVRAGEGRSLPQTSSQPS